MAASDLPHGRPARRWFDDITDCCGCTQPETGDPD